MNYLLLSTRNVYSKSLENNYDTFLSHRLTYFLFISEFNQVKLRHQTLIGSCLVQVVTYTSFCVHIQRVPKCIHILRMSSVYNMYIFFWHSCIYLLILLAHPSHALCSFSKIRKIKQSFLLNRRLYMPRRVIAYCHYRPSQVLPQGLFRSHSYIPFNGST